jgi:peptidoglycan/LPS O-acetylase OafA/YrhL
MGVSWLAGVLIVYLPPVAFSSGWKRTARIIAVLCLFICCMVMNKIRPGILSDLLLNAAVVILIWQALQKRAGTLPVTYARVSQRCARSSYTTYLVHFPMIIFLKALWNVQRTDLGWKSGIMSMALLLTVIVYAQAIYEIFEKNTDKIRNWIKPYILRAAK